MPNSRIFSLLVGIEEYAPGSLVSNLHACLNDVSYIEKYLYESFPSDILSIKKLLNQEATYDRLIISFKNHFKEISKGDTAFFYYAGHGSYTPTAVEFLRDHKPSVDKTLVCYDSRLPGGLDFADKELAILIDEIAQKGAHVVIMLDTCYSGSDSRDRNDVNFLASRCISPREDKRSLGSYLGGYYLEHEDIPTGKHILLTAASHYQKAWENYDGHGIFTQSMLEVLSNHSYGISYADLFYKVKAKVNQKTIHQTPQFQTAGFFQAHDRFLGGRTLRQAPRFRVFFDADPSIHSWMVDGGAFHRFSTDINQKTEMNIYEDMISETPIAHARTLTVGTNKSIIDFSYPYTQKEFVAELLTIPEEPHLIFLHVPESYRVKLTQLHDDHFSNIFVEYTDVKDIASHGIILEDGVLILTSLPEENIIYGIKGGVEEDMLINLLQAVEKIINWQRIWDLQNHQSKFKDQEITFMFSQRKPDGSFHKFREEDGTPQTHIRLHVEKKGGHWGTISFNIEAGNHRSTGFKPLHVAIIYVSHKYGINTLYTGILPTTPQNEYTVLVDDPNMHIGMTKEWGEITERLKLIVSTHPIDSLLIDQDNIDLGKIIDVGNAGTGRSVKGVTGERIQKIDFDWFVKDITYTLVGVQNELSKEDIELAEGRIVIKGHEELTASVQMRTDTRNSRSVNAMEELLGLMPTYGAEPISFPTTSGIDYKYLEMTGLPLDYDLSKKSFSAGGNYSHFRRGSNYGCRNGQWCDLSI